MGVVQTIKPRRSWSSSAPIGLAQGEIASNLTLKKIYIGTGSENIEFPDTSGIADMIAAAPFLPLGGGEINGNLTVVGNLIVDGDTITANVETMTVEDPIITLGGTTAPTVNDALDRGVEFRWHNGTVAKTGFFGFDRSSQKFTFIPDATNNNEVFDGAKGTIVANLEGNASTATKVNNAVTFNNGGAGAASGATFDGSTARTISYNTIGAAALAGSLEQDFSTKNLTVHGHLQIGSARLVYVPETEDLPAYLKLQHSDGTGTTVMHFVTSGGVTMYSAGMPSGASIGGATVLLNGEPTESATFWAPTSAGSSGQYLTSSGGGAPVWTTIPTATSLVAGIMKLGASGGAATYEHAHSFQSITSKPTTIDGYGITDAVYSSHLTGGSAHGVATTGANGFMSSGDKTNLNLLYTNRLIYDAGDKADLAAALTSIPSTFYKEGLLLKYADSNEQHIYMYISTTAMDGTTKTNQGNWLRISKPDVDGGTY